MSFLSTDERQRRIIQLAQQWSVALPPAPSRLSRPQEPPSFRLPQDDLTAEDLLQRQAIEAAQLRPKSGLTRAFSSNSLKKGKNWEPKDVLTVLTAWIANGGSPGVAEALLARLAAGGVDLSLPATQKQKSGLLGKRRSIDAFIDRTKLLRLAVDRDQADMVKVLLPHADPAALDTCVPTAIRRGNQGIVRSLLSYGANVSQTADGQDAFRQACILGGQAALVTLILQSDGRPSPAWMSQSMADAARTGCLDTVMQLSRSTADGDHNRGEALKAAIDTGRRDIALALVMGNQPPQRPGLDEAFGKVYENPSLHHQSKIDLAELLLCAGAQGDARVLELACETQDFTMASLLARYGVSLDHNDGAVLKSAIARGQLDLVGSLLNERAGVSPALASSSVKAIPRQISFENRHRLLTALLNKGASGDSLGEALIDAAVAGDEQSVDLLVKPFFPDASPGANGQRQYRRHEVASVDYKSGEALRSAVLRGDKSMAQRILAGQPSAQTLTTIFPLTKNLSPEDRYHMVRLFLQGPLAGSSLHAALQDAINEDIAKRDDALIQLLLSHGADINFDHGSGLHAVVQQKDMQLFVTLVQKVSPQTAAAQVSSVMKVTDDHRTRHDMLNLLLNAGAAIGRDQVSKALVTTLAEKPVDMSLLRLLLQEGSADINGCDNNIVKQAVRNPDPKVLELVFSFSKPSQATITHGLNELASLPSTDGKAWKVKVILSKASHQEDLGGLLVHEVQSLIRDSAKHPSFGTIKMLLESGADPNVYKAASLCHATVAAETQICDLLFGCQKPPTPASLGCALPHALRIPDLMNRLALVKRLIDAGALPAEVNQALTHAINTYPDDVGLLGVLATGADTSDGEALGNAVNLESPEILELLLSKAKHTPQAREQALMRSLNIRDRATRRVICAHLLTAGVSSQTSSTALLTAARDGDRELGDLLMAHGASISDNSGQAIVEACRGGSVDVLKVLLRSGVAKGDRILAQGFQAATEIGDLHKRALIFEQLLKNGVKGDVLDAQLQSAVRYGENGKAVLRVLLIAGADPNFNNGEAVVAAVSSAYIGGLELLLGLWDEAGSQIRPDGPTLNRALKSCWALSRDTRYQVLIDLAKAGLPITEDLHIALNKCVNEEFPETRVAKLLMDHGASPLTNDCKTLVDATQKVESGILQIILAKDIPQQHIDRAFSLAFQDDGAGRWFSQSGLDTAKMLLEEGARGEAITGTLVTVMKTCSLNDPGLADSFVKLLVSYSPDVDWDKGEALQQAASRANVSWVEELLKCRPSVKTLSMAFQRIFDTALPQEEALDLFRIFADYQDGETRVDVMAIHPTAEPLIVQAMSQYPRSSFILETLLNAGCYHDQVTKYRLHPDVEELEEITLLTWAIAQPQKLISGNLIQILIDRGAKVNVESPLTRLTPLTLAVQERRLEVVKSLLIDSADVDVLDFQGRTPLSIATEIGGELSIQLMGCLLAAEPSKDDGSLHNAARELNFSAVKVLVQAGHDPDFPSPAHGGRSALAEVCLKTADAGEVEVERERSMHKVMTHLIEAGSDLTIKSNGKSLLHLCFDSRDPITITRALLKSGMWKHVNKPFNHFTDETYTYSITMYISKVLPPSDSRDRLLALLRNNRAKDVFYANEGPQPGDAAGLPDDMEVEERERKARLQRRAADSEDFALTLARKRELANVEHQIWASRAQVEDARRRKLHGDDLEAVHARSQLEESLATQATQRRISEQRALTNAALSRTRALASTEMETDDARRHKAIEWESKLNTERVDNARALTSVRLGEREELERMDKAADDRLRKRLEAQRKLVDGQERLARRLADGPGGGVTDARRQIGYVTEIN